MTIRCAILTVSDRCARGEAEDRSGPAVRQLITERLGAIVTHADCVPDEPDRIERVVRSWLSDDVDLILTTGGTGLAPRDVTPEVVTTIIDRPVPGLMELARARCAPKTIMTYLSRGVAGVADRTLIVTLPGSVAGATETLDAITQLLPHAVQLLQGDTDNHPPAGGGKSGGA